MKAVQPFKNDDYTCQIRRMSRRRRDSNSDAGEEGKGRLCYLLHMLGRIYRKGLGEYGIAVRCLYEVMKLDLEVMRRLGTGKLAA